MIETLSELVLHSVDRQSNAPAIQDRSASLNYGELWSGIERVASALATIGVSRGDRVAIFAGKQNETVLATLGASRAGAIFVPINALFKQKQVAYILRNCAVKVLVTTSVRAKEIADVLDSCAELTHVLVIDANDSPDEECRAEISTWSQFIERSSSCKFPRVISSDVASIMYTSGSTGKPKGVVLSHNNMVIGAQSVAKYLENSSDDRILAVLPFSFDAGLSQLTTGLSVGACVVLHDYLIARDVVRIVEKESITGITGVPPLWMQLADQSWPASSTESVRYFANTGGKMPRETLSQLRKIFPHAKPYLMYGLTEAFRSTYLPPEEVDKRPDSIGKAIPNVEVLVVNEHGRRCKPGEPGELVHRGPLVALGYWNDPERTSTRFRSVPDHPPELPIREYAVWSGDFVTMDEDGYLYFVGRKDDMIKTSGYRVSPSELEEIAFDSKLVSEVAALGLPDERLGHEIVLVAKSKNAGDSPTDELIKFIRRQVPNYMIPSRIFWQDSLPRNANGKLDRRKMTADLLADSED